MGGGGGGKERSYLLGHINDLYASGTAAVATSVFTFLYLMTTTPDPPNASLQSVADFVLTAVAVGPTAVAFWRYRAAIPAYLPSFGPVFASYYYAHYYMLDYRISSSLFEILVTATAYWIVGVTLGAGAVFTSKYLNVR